MLLTFEARFPLSCWLLIDLRIKIHTPSCEILILNTVFFSSFLLFDELFPVVKGLSLLA